MAVGRNLLDGHPSEWSLLRRHRCEDLFGIQVSVGSPDQARLLGQLLETSELELDFVDLNCGCPLGPICGKGLGCALMDSVPRLGRICTSLASAISCPLTIKVRKGLRTDVPIVHTFADRLVDWQVSALTVHGRSRHQRYNKPADWDYISQCARVSAVPTIGNGDIFHWTDVEEKVQQCGVQSVMLARGVLVKPWLLTEIKERRVWDISATERLDILKQFYSFGLDHWGGDRKGLLTIRRFMCEWLAFLCRYVPVGILEQPQRLSSRIPAYTGRNELETLMASSFSEDWIKLSSLVMGPAPEGFKFTAKHKSTEAEG